MSSRGAWLATTVFALLLAAGCATAPAPESAPPAPPTAPETPAQAVIPAGPVNLVVDHAWVKDADTPDLQAAQAASMDALRARVVAGEALGAAWSALGVDGTNWHVAEGESYPGDVLPEGVSALRPGAVSAVVPGDGGLHLFRIISKEQAQ